MIRTQKVLCTINVQLNSLIFIFCTTVHKTSLKVGHALQKQFTEKIFNGFRQVIIVAVFGGQFKDITYTESMGFTPEFLTVLFRNPCHISSFSSTLLNEGKDIDEVSATVTGTYVSSQAYLEYYYFENFNSTVVSLENRRRKSSALILFSDSHDFDTNIKENRFVVERQCGIKDAPFGGIESDHVYIVVDTKIPSQKYPLLNLAINRSSGKVEIYIMECYKESFDTFIEYGKIQGLRKTLLEARNGEPVDVTFLGEACRWTKKKKKETEQLVVKLLQVAFVNSDISLLERLKDAVGEDNLVACYKLKSMWIRSDEFFELLNRRQTKQFLEKIGLDQENSDPWNSFLGRLFNRLLVPLFFFKDTGCL